MDKTATTDKLVIPNKITQLETAIRKALEHINNPFSWCGLSDKQMFAVYYQVRGKSAHKTGKIMGKSRHTVRKYLEQAVEIINKAEDWEIEIRDLADVLFKLIEEELDGNTNEE